MIQPKVAVLLAAYNGEKWISTQIESIIRQKDVSIDIYISLDISSDDTENIIKALVAETRKIVLLPYGEKYGGAAPNFFRLISDVPIDKYDYISLSDQDDVWFENKLITAIEALKKTKSDGYSSNVMAFWPNGKTKIINKATKQRECDYLFEGPGPGCTFVITKKIAIDLKKLVIERANQIRQIDWHDWFIYAFARSRDYSWYIDKKSLMKYRQHNANQLGANMGFAAFMQRVRRIYSGYGIEQTRQIIRTLKLEDTPFISRWFMKKRSGYIFLAFNSCKCRRKCRDRFFFFCSCILMIIVCPVEKKQK